MSCLNSVRLRRVRRLKPGLRWVRWLVLVALIGILRRRGVCSSGGGRSIRHALTRLALWAAVVPGVWCTVSWTMWRAIVLTLLDWLLAIRGA